MHRLIIATALGLGIVAAPATAEDRIGPFLRKPVPPSAIIQTMPLQGRQEPSKRQRTGLASDTFAVESQNDHDWLATSLVGRPVQNAAGQLVGRISDVVLDQAGEVKAVLIGVGGFLGIGQKTIGVRFTALSFEQRQQEAGAVGPAGLPLAPRPKKQPVQRKDALHSELVIVLDVPQEQIHAAPAYLKIGEARAD